MRSSLKQSPFYPSALLVRPRSPLPIMSVSPAASSNYRRRPLLSLKPVHLFSTFKPRLVLECSAASDAAPTSGGQKIMDFCFWTGQMPNGGFVDCFIKLMGTSFSYIFYINFAKVALEFFPYPWLFSVIYLASGILFTLLKRYDPPVTELAFWMSLVPVAVANAIGLVATMVSLSKCSLYFTELMRCAEPVFGMLLSSLFLLGGKWYPLPVYLSLFPIIAGCALAAATEQNFNPSGFMAAMIANFAYTSMNILLERGIGKKMDGDVKKKGKTVTGPNYGACISMLSLLIVIPFFLAIEGPRLWATGWKKATLEGNAYYLFMFIVTHSIMYGIYTEKIYRFLPFIHFFPFFTINNIEKIFLIAVSITFVKPVQPLNALGAAIAVLGTFLHSQELCKVFISKSGSCNTIGFLHTCCS